MTAGRVIEAPLAPVIGVPLNGSGLSNPATAIALANRPTPTPNYRSCPEPNPAATLAATAPPNARLMDDAIVRYLSEGGDTVTLENTLRDSWNVLAGGAVRGDVDLTGEGTPEIILTYSTPDEGGVLLIEGCIDGRYLTRYQAALGGATPEILTVADLNYNGIPELLFASKDCTAACVYHTQMVTWNPEHGRFINLLGGAITSDQVPVAQDIDGDHVLELLDKFDNDGDKTTGPLRTGYTVYDWNGVGYVQSVTQLDPPRFRIQVIQEADAAFAAQHMDDAISLYNLALGSASLANWYNDDAETLKAYALYRLMLAYAFTESDQRLPTQQTIQQTYPDLAAAPPYAQMALDFWGADQITNNLHSACLKAQEDIITRPDALNLLNRYGSRSPTYTATDLCPF
ncbi:MAG: hypothetical protein GC204_09495 [Chloroflexi bacterium]|nr:hypothetical protein [Chloroflexota bacterium]